ncbi:glycosyltransferase [Marinimicrobium agarilyticum]|uniref:glycosyltransferase n=1 Tax=Marinimicrobium agarilyticum TaxID=306546 RepID=UPI00041E19D6|nr:glycosyltransferase [Marinimicrobium agarilyticum]
MTQQSQALLAPLTEGVEAGLRVAVISDAAPGRNGVGAYYQDLLEQLGPQMSEVQLFSPTVENGRWRTGLALPLPGDRTQKLCVPNPWALKRALRRLRPQVVVVATPGPYGLLGVRLARRAGIPVLAGFHTSFEQLTQLYWQGSWRGRLVHSLFERSHRYLFAGARSVLGNSRDMLELAERMGAPATGLIGTPISAEFALTERRPYGGELERVLFAGRLAAEKNLEAVVDAASAHPSVQFSIAGDGPLRARMAAAAEALPNLKLLGWLDRAALRAEVDHHDLLLLPSHFESFGTIALEAMARERLVLVSSGCGIVQWPSLRSGLSIIHPEESAASALQRLREKTAPQRRELAQTAAGLALSLNERCLAHWCELLRHTVDSRSPLPSTSLDGVGSALEQA